MSETRDITLHLAELITGENRASAGEIYDALIEVNFQIWKDDAAHGFQIGGPEAISYAAVVISFFGSILVQATKDAAAKFLADRLKAFVEQNIALSRADLETIHKRIEKAVASGKLTKEKGDRLWKDIQVTLDKGPV